MYRVQASRRTCSHTSVSWRRPLPSTPVEVDISPETLNLKSQGKWVTAYVELSEGFDVADVNVSTMKVNGTVPAESSPAALGDYDSDGVPDLMVKFERAAVVQQIIDNAPIQGRLMIVTLTISGELRDGTLFEGSDTIRAIIPISRGMSIGTE